MTWFVWMDSGEKKGGQLTDVFLEVLVSIAQREGHTQRRSDAVEDKQSELRFQLKLNEPVSAV